MLHVANCVAKVIFRLVAPILFTVIYSATVENGKGGFETCTVSGVKQHGGPSTQLARNQQIAAYYNSIAKRQILT